MMLGKKKPDCWQCGTELKLLSVHECDIESYSVGRAAVDDLVDFDDFGAPTLRDEVGGIPYFVNEFWTAKQRQANRLHEVSYRACFKPQLPAFFIERLTAPDDVVYDPFMGRGTTLIEAALRGRTPFGNDTNPLSKALVEPRLCPPSLASIAARLDNIPWENFKDVTTADLLAFYHPITLAHIEGLRAWLIERENSGTLDGTDRWIRMVAINRLTGHSSGFFSVYTLPPNQAVTVKRQLKINENRDQVPPLRDVRSIILKKSKSLLSQSSPNARNHTLTTRQAEHTPEIADKSVSLVVTSPPFLDVVNYEADNWLRCWFLAVDPKSVNISMHKKVEDWQAFTKRTLTELARVTKPQGHIAFEVGEVRNGTVRLEENVIAAASGLPLEPLGVMINQQEFTKTANCWGVKNNSAGTNSNRIVIFRKV